MIICKRHQIHSQIIQIRHIRRFGSECKLFAFRGCSPVRIREFIVKHHNICILHFFNQFRCNCCRDITTILQHCTHNSILRIEKNIPSKSNCYLIRILGILGINIVLCHVFRVIENIQIFIISIHNLTDLRLHVLHGNSLFG